MTTSKPVAIILVAGMGSRLGRPHPKCMTSLDNGETILSRQLRILTAFELGVIAVVGFKKDLVMEAAAEALFAYNPNYDTTNTSKSLLCGLQHVVDQDVLWLNGDVVFAPEVIQRVLDAPSSSVAVNNARVAEEEVKYSLDANGYIDAISKTVSEPLGEALGINLVRAEHLELFKGKLDEADASDYFERAMELAIEQQGQVFKPVDVSDLACVEVDFAEDLAMAREMVGSLK